MGGNLDLHSDPLNPEVNQVTKCSVGFNNCVILETSSKSWHGFPAIELPESDVENSRKCIAVYYYTQEVPDYDTKLNRSTVYIDEPLPDHIRAGRNSLTLTLSSSGSYSRFAFGTARNSSKRWSIVAWISPIG